MGHYSTSEDKMLGLIQLAIANGQQKQGPRQMVTGLSMRELEAAGMQVSKFAILQMNRISGASSSSSSSGRGADVEKTSPQKRLSAVISFDDAMSVICEAIISKLAINLMVSGADMIPSSPLPRAVPTHSSPSSCTTGYLATLAPKISVIDVLQSQSLLG